MSVTRNVARGVTQSVARGMTQSGARSPSTRAAPSAERVLVVRVGAMGDVLHALPGVAALRQQRPEVLVDWVVDPRWAPLLMNGEGVGPVVSRVHLAETRLWSRAPFSRATRRSVLQLKTALRQSEYRLTVDLQGTLRSAIIGRFAGKQPHAGFDDPRERAARLFYTDPVPRQGRHVTEQGAALLGRAVLGADLSPLPSVALPVEPAKEEWAQGIAASAPDGKRFVLLAPTAGWRAKQWPVEQFAALARALAERGYGVLSNAARADEPVARALLEASGGVVRPLPCSVAELIALTQRAALVVGGDTGPVHLAAALGVPTVALFGPTDPARNGPWGAGPMRVLRHPDSVTSYKRRVEVDPGLARLPVDEVLTAAEELLSA